MGDGAVDSAGCVIVGHGAGSADTLGEIVSLAEGVSSGEVKGAADSVAGAFVVSGTKGGGVKRWPDLSDS